MLYDEAFVDGGTGHDLMAIDPQYHGAPAARSALYAALQAAAEQTSVEQSVASFQSSVGAWMRPNVEFLFNPSGLFLGRAKVIEEKRNLEREFQQKHGEVYFSCTYCKAGLSRTMPLCKRCGSAPYCSCECQVADWPKYKAQCKILSKMKRAQAES